MSTFLEIQDEVLAHGFDPNTYRARVRVWVNEGLKRVARTTRIRDFQATYTLAMVPGLAYYALPTDFVRLGEVVDLALDKVLGTEDMDTIDVWPAASGVPNVYALGADGITFYPTPDAARDITLRYWKSGAVLSADGDTPGFPDAYHDALVKYALIRAYASEDDYQASAFWKAEFLESLAALKNDRQDEDTAPRQVQGSWEWTQTEAYRR